MGFTIVTIEGEGDDAEYVRLADDLVRRSSLFKSFTWHQWRTTEEAGKQKTFRLRWKAKFKEVQAEFKEYEKSAKRMIAYQTKEAEKAKLRLKAEQKRYFTLRALNNRTIQNLRLGIRNSKPLLKYRSIVQQNERFFTTRFNWRSTMHNCVRAELMLRCLHVYEAMKANNEVSYSEVMYLSVGTQLKTFRREDIEQRFPETKYFERDMKLMMAVGYIDKLHRKQIYYITYKGKERFKEIISRMYSVKMGTYWKGTLTDLK